MKTNTIYILLAIIAIAYQATAQDTIPPPAASPEPIGWGLASVSAGLVTSGSALHFVPGLQHINNDVRDNVQQWRNSPPRNGAALHVDNYLQYTPAASAYILKICGVPSKHNYCDLTLISAETFLTSSIVVVTMKTTIDIQRPDQTAYNSFPSGHTATAFAGAEILRNEYWETTPWIGIVGYTIATATGLLRIYNNRHWTGDVLTGAGIGILSARFANWINPKVRQIFLPQKRHLTNQTTYDNILSD